MAREGERVKKLRLGLGFSQERFARLVGVSLQTVRRWEEGLNRPLPIISLRLDELQKGISEIVTTGGGVSMTGKKKPEAKIEVGLGGLFKGIGSLLDVVSKMTEEGKEEYVRTGETETGPLKGVYGISVRMGLGGKPVIEQFGNIRETPAGPQVAEVREPLVDVMDEGERLVVIAELPGVEADGIQVQVRGDILELSAEGKGRKYQKEVLLPSPVEEASLESTYRNGVLELKLNKKQAG